MLSAHTHSTSSAWGFGDRVRNSYGCPIGLERSKPTKKCGSPPAPSPARTVQITEVVVAYMMPISTPPRKLGSLAKSSTHGVHRAIGVSAEGISVGSAIRTSACEDFIPANTIDVATGHAKATTELSTLGIRASQVCSHVRRCCAEAKGFHVVMKD